MAEPVEGGFVVPLPYGEEVDWLKNVLRAGRATIEANGATYPVVDAEIVDCTVAFPLLPPRLRLAWRSRVCELGFCANRSLHSLSTPSAFARQGLLYSGAIAMP